MSALLQRWFPKPILSWREPKGVSAARARLETKRIGPAGRILTVALIFGVTMALWAGSTTQTDKDPLPFSGAMLMGLLAGAAFGWGLPYLYRCLPTTVRVFDYGVVRTVGDANTLFRFEHMTGYSISDSQPPLLHLQMGKGDDGAVGIATDMDRGWLVTLLEERGIPCLEKSDTA